MQKLFQTFKETSINCNYILGKYYVEKYLIMKCFKVSEKNQFSTMTHHDIPDSENWKCNKFVVFCDIISHPWHNFLYYLDN